jgi:hypothetical protein
MLQLVWHSLLVRLLLLLLPRWHLLWPAYVMIAVQKR